MRSAHRADLCVLCVSLKKERLFLYTLLTDRFLGAFAKQWRATISFIMLVCPPPLAWSSSATRKGIFMKFYITLFFKNLSRKFKFHQHLTRTTGTLQEDKYIFLVISRSVLARRRNVSDKSYRENQNSYFICSKFFFFPKIEPFMR
jgi:hypothetical protein